MTQPFLSELSIETLDANLFRGTAREGAPGRIFGGQVAAQALVAAGRTVGDDKLAHSCHGFFLRAGDPARPVIYDVDRIRDGGSFTTRRVRALQAGQAIFNLSASFHVSEPGPDYQTPRSHEVVPGPDTVDGGGWRDGIVDVREVSALVDPADRGGTVRRLVWFRVPGPMPAVDVDPLAHAAAITYVSDHGPIGALRLALLPDAVEGEEWGLIVASLDHCVWFHRPARADEWLLLDVEARVAGRGRGLSTGTIATTDGEVVASIAQEALLRVPRER
ncbi:MAG: thioesterase family protein [Actinomycetota bacterium]|nr:thioesterase family protein [Actinomycetota bacterium]